MTDTQTTAPHVTVRLVEGRKSLGLALILTFLFGPLGLLYASALWGLVMIVLGAIVGFVSLGLGLVVIWPLSMGLAALLVWRRNAALARQMQNPMA